MVQPDFLRVFVLLLLAHAIGDYAFQSSWMAQEKQKSFYVLFIHAMVWTASIVVMSYLAGYQPSTFLVVAVLLVPHTLMDYAKAQSASYIKLFPNPKWQLTIDQSVHYTQIIIFTDLLIRTQGVF